MNTFLKNVTSSKTVVTDPPLAKFLFSDTRFSIVWLVVRVFVGLQWLNSGWGKFNNVDWMEAGVALQGYWERAVAIPEQGRPPITYDWYRNFIQGLLDSGAYVWFAKLIAYGELLVGIGLIVGAFVGVAAFAGAFMNWNFIMAGAASSNGLLGIAAILLVLAWKTAGYIGADFFLLRWLGTPWGRRTTEKYPEAVPQPAAGD
jgi:thiosulfate dehydrogenase (quinone) large subunit